MRPGLIIVSQVRADPEIRTAFLLSVDFDYMLVSAVSSEFDTSVNMFCKLSPRVVKAPIAATDTSAAMRPYSMAVAPDSSPQNCLKRFSMIKFAQVQVTVECEYICSVC